MPGQVMQPYWEKNAHILVFPMFAIGINVLHNLLPLWLLILLGVGAVVAFKMHRQVSPPQACIVWSDGR